MLLLTLLLSYLMISTVRFRTFREFRFSPLAITIIAMVAASAVIVLVLADITLLLVLIGGIYISAGLLEEVLFFRFRRTEDDVYYLNLEDEAEAVAEEGDEEEAPA